VAFIFFIKNLNLDIKKIFVFFNVTQTVNFNIHF
jgi:hypothetical protein